MSQARITHNQAEAWMDEANECRRNAEIATKDDMTELAATLLKRAAMLERKVQRAMDNA